MGSRTGQRICATFLVLPQPAVAPTPATPFHGNVALRSGVRYRRSVRFLLYPLAFRFDLLARPPSHFLRIGPVVYRLLRFADDPSLGICEDKHVGEIAGILSSGPVPRRCGMLDRRCRIVRQIVLRPNQLFDGVAIVHPPFVAVAGRPLAFDADVLGMPLAVADGGNGVRLDAETDRLVACAAGHDRVLLVGALPVMKTEEAVLAPSDW